MKKAKIKLSIEGFTQIDDDCKITDLCAREEIIATLKKDFKSNYDIIIEDITVELKTQWIFYKEANYGYKYWKLFK